MIQVLSWTTTNKRTKSEAINNSVLPFIVLDCLSDFFGKSNLSCSTLKQNIRISICTGELKVHELVIDEEKC